MPSWIGWVATAAFACSYLCRQPATLRRVQAGAAVLWVVYGLSIQAAPVVVANLVVAVAAVWSSFGRTAPSCASPPIIAPRSATPRSGEDPAA